MKKTLTLLTLGLMVAALSAQTSQTSLRPRHDGHAVIPQQQQLAKFRQATKSGATTLDAASTPQACQGEGLTAFQQRSIAIHEAPQRASHFEDELIDEDFSAFTTGSIDEPDRSKSLAGGDNGYSYIDASLTKDGQWSGTYVYSAGGMACLYSPSVQTCALLNTPLGDYSGNITVTCRVKAIPTYNYDDQSGTSYRITGSSLVINPYIGGPGSTKYADVDDDWCEVRLYPEMGWTDVTYTFTNQSADNDGFISFCTNEALVIDDIKVTCDSYEFIAQPANVRIEDMHENDFTVAWDPVRHSYNYYVDVWEKVYTSSTFPHLTADFNDGTLPEGFTYSGDAATFEDGVGVDGSKAFVLEAQKYLETPNSGKKYRAGTYYLKLNLKEGSDLDDYYDTYLKIYGLTDKGWTSLGYFYVDYYAKGDYADLAADFGSKYVDNVYAVRFEPHFLDDGATLTIDDIDITTDANYRLKRIYAGSDLVGVGDPWECYEETEGPDETSMKITGVKPKGDYYYAVRSHYLSLWSTSDMHHVMAIAAPETDLATDIDSRGSYTANWKSIAKAESYTVTNYGVYTAEEDGEYYLIDEDFERINGDVTSATDPNSPESLLNDYAISLDNYTDVPGWYGSGYNNVCIGMVGCDTSSSDTGIIHLPTLTLDGDSEYYLGVIAWGTPGDMLVMKTTSGTYGATFGYYDATHGAVGDTFIIPGGNKEENIYFYSNNGAAFLLDRVTVSQKIKAGKQVFTKLENVTVPATETSYTFTDLPTDLYDSFAYTVKANYTADGDNVSSEDSNMIIVDLVRGRSFEGIGDVAEATTAGNATIESIYTVDGLRTNNLRSGVNILRMSDGSVRKMFKK